MTRTRALLLALLLAWAVATVQAQTVATTTTLSANVSATATTISVTSGTGFTVNNFAWVDAEQMLIRAVSGTAITVSRGVNGTAARAHDNTERVITGAADYFHTNDPDYGQDCVRGEAQAAFSPWINVRTGTVWVCNAFQNSRWTSYSTLAITYDSIPTSF